MHIMTENGWKSLNGFAEKLAAAAAEKREAIAAARRVWKDTIPGFADPRKSSMELRRQAIESNAAFNRYYAM